MATITRRFEFDSGHRIVGHESKCSHLHGHRYRAEVTIDAPALDELGRVIDFGVVKEIIGTWIDDNWDHNMLLHEGDPLLKAVMMLDEHVSHETLPSWEETILGRQPYIMPDARNPTAENIAAVLRQRSQELLHEAGMHDLLVTRVRVYETPNCWADAFPIAAPQKKRQRTMWD